MSENAHINKSDQPQNGRFRKKLCGDGFIVRMLAYTANAVMMIFAGFVFSHSYGNERFLVLLLFIPPLLSIWALRKQGDREERDLRKRIRKAYLRKELKSLSEFDA